MSEYEDVLILIEHEFDTYVGTAKTFIPRLRDVLLKDGKTPEEIKDRILADCDKFWTRQTIMNTLGDEYKDIKQREAGQKGIEKKKKIALTISNNGQTSPNDYDNRAGIFQLPLPDTNTNDGQQQTDGNSLPESDRVSSDSYSQKEQESDTFDKTVKKLEKAGYDIKTDEKDELISQLEKKIETYQKHRDDKFEELESLQRQLKQSQDQNEYYSNIIRKYEDTDDESDNEDLQIKLNDLQTALENEKNERLQFQKLLDREREKVKELESITTTTTSTSHFTPASELSKKEEEDDDSSVIRSTYKKIIGDLNTRILELKDKLVTKSFKETIEIRGQRIVLDVKCSNLESIQVDELDRD